MEATNPLWPILLFPLLGALINGLISLRGWNVSKQIVNVVAIGSVAATFAYVLVLINQSWANFSGAELGTANYMPYVERYFTWITAGEMRIGFDLAMDRITALMLMVICGVGLLIHTYATGYMAHEDGYARFFAYLNLFMFFMLTLVLGANYLVMFVGWEGVGLCSYLLIGFYFKEKWATSAGNKAFIVNRIGDCGFLLAMLLIAVNFGSLDFVTVFNKASQTMKVEPNLLAAGLANTICLLLFVGAMGKSAQLPLYVWLPDAMAGPTPVSALIHAATMVTAGVYVVARSSVLFDLAPFAQHVVALVGLATAVFAAIIGLAQMDIKKVFAYSTVSQLGYMFLALGVGSYSGALFHVMTHAFFKALLFLGAGSVIHALEGEQDLSKMGGLRTKTPITFFTLIIAGLAIAGVPPLSGFHSKDEILLAAHHHAPWMFWVGTITAGMTAFYVFRALFLTFFGEYRGKAHPHESPFVMTGPLVVLAVLSAVGGYLSAPKWLAPMFASHAVEHDQTLVIIASAAGLVGIALAAWLYWLSPKTGTSLATALGPVNRLVTNKFYVDEIYDSVIVQPIVFGSRMILSGLIDHFTIGGFVHSILGQGSARLGGLFSKFQSGYVRSYATWIVVGCVMAIFAVALGGRR
jgi:NADH-quinone oxidoreductase subunit L